MMKEENAIIAYAKLEQYIERLEKENKRMREVILLAQGQLSPLDCLPKRFAITIRDVLTLLRDWEKS